MKWGGLRRVGKRWPARAWLSGAVALMMAGGTPPARAGSSKIVAQVGVTPTYLSAGAATPVLICFQAQNGGAKATLRAGDVFTVAVPATLLRAQLGAPEIVVFSSLLRAGDFQAKASPAGDRVTITYTGAPALFRPPDCLAVRIPLAAAIGGGVGLLEVTPPGDKSRYDPLLGGRVLMNVGAAVAFSVTPGAVGPAGPAGPPGAVGPAGPAGPSGPAGVKGDKGDQGVRGDKGDKGDRGPAGPAGPAGSKGDKGDSGDLPPPPPTVAARRTLPGAVRMAVKGSRMGRVGRRSRPAR